VKVSEELFLRTTQLNIVKDNPDSVTEVVSAVTDDKIIKLLTDQSHLYHSQNAHQYKISPKTLNWPNITTSETKKFLGLIILMG
jgi:hypothetical protein